MGNSIQSDEKTTNFENVNEFYQQKQNVDFKSDKNVKTKKNPVKEDEEKQEEKKISKKLGNPGTVEEIHKECRDIMPNFYEGARLTLNKCLSNYFQLTHTIKLLPNKNESCYRFGATYVGSKRHGLYESYPILYGEIEKSGNMQASIVHCPSRKSRIKIGVEYQGKHLVGGQFIGDYLGKSYTASIGIANPNIINNSGIFLAQYLQSVTQKLALGSELACQYGLLYPEGALTVFNIISKYRTDNSIFSTSLGGSGIHLSYMKEASPQLKLGVEFNTNFDAQSSYTTFGYQVTLPKADVIFHGSLDTNWNVCSVLEKKLKPLPFAFSLSALLNHKTGKFKLGCGLVIG